MIADTLIPVLVGEAQHRHDLRVEQDPDGHLLLVVRGIITLNLNGFLLTRALRDAGFPDADLVNEILEDAELFDDDLRGYGYALSPSTIEKLHDVAQAVEPTPVPLSVDHEPQVLNYTRARGPSSRVYSGWCPCGWRGPSRDELTAVETDTEIHLKAMNR